MHREWALCKKEKGCLHSRNMSSVAQFLNASLPTLASAYRDGAVYFNGRRHTFNSPEDLNCNNS